MTGEELGRKPAFAGTGSAVSYPVGLPLSVLDELRTHEFKVSGMTTRVAIAKDICAAIVGGMLRNSEMILTVESIARDAVRQTDGLLDELAKEAGSDTCPK